MLKSYANTPKSKEVLAGLSQGLISPAGMDLAIGRQPSNEQ